ncbi:MAG: fibronectin type III domain-containing protein, partial [Tissierellaceae bacterium]|nr:fibronectin type III domain-containing protein [Tissierellaceae bacterium]
LYFYAGTAGTYNIAALPPIDQSIMLNTLRVNFKYRNTYATDTLKVGVMTDPNVASTWTQVGWVKAPTTATWGDYEVSLASYQGTGQYIALRADYSTTYTYAYVDDLVVSYIPACAKPSNFSVSNITTTSADIAWTPGNSTDFAWWVYYSVAGSGVWDSVYATMNPYTLTNLNPSSPYEFYLRTDCGVELSEPSAISVFYTACATITSVPWSENFDTYSTGSSSYPNCWTKKSSNPSNHYISSTNFSPPGSLYFYTSTAGGYNIAILPPFDNTIPVNTLRLKFKYRTSYLTDTMKIGIMSDTSLSSWTQVAFVTAPSTYTWIDCEIPLNSYQGTGQYIALRQDYGSSYNYGYIDDFEVSYIPSCAKPTNLATNNATTNSIDLSWTPGNTTDFAWWIYYRPAGTTAWDSTYATMNPHTLNLLNTSTSYEVEIRTDCGVELSEASSLAYFQTLCASIDGLTDLPWNEGFEGIAAVNDLPACWSATGLGTYTYTQIADYGSYNRNARTGTKSAYFEWYCNDKFTTPTFDLYAGQTYAFSFWYVTDGYSGWQNLKAGVKSVTDTSINQIVGSPMTNVTNTSYQMYLGTFTPSTNDTYEFSIECTADGTPYYLTIDDIRLEISNCGMPENVTFSNLTTTSVDLNWDMGNNSQWIVSYKLSSGSTWTDDLAVTNSYSFINLAPQTAYDFKIASICGLDTSMYVVKSLTTPCPPINTLPWLENFNSYPDETFPPCWFRPVVYFDSYAYQNLPAVDNYWGTQHSMMITSDDVNNPTYVITPQINFDINALRIRFKLEQENLNYSGSITVGLVSNPYDLTTFDSITTVKPTTLNYTSYEVSFANSTLTGFNNCIVFRHNP